MVQPDLSSKGFLAKSVDPLRYQPSRFSFHESGVFGIVSSFIPKGSRVLDVGCGTGWMSRHLRDEGGCETVGVEPDPVRAEEARGSGLDVIIGVLQDVDVDATGRFDVVLFGDVLEHLSDPGQVLGLAKKYLRPGGLVVASVPNVAHWTVRLLLLSGRFDYKPTGIMDATHLRWFTARTAKGLFEGSGYRVVRWRTTAGLELGCYRYPPFKWLGAKGRAWFVCLLNRAFPRLIGVQHVIQAALDA